MSFSVLPAELKWLTTEFVGPTKLSREEVRSSGRELLQISLVDKELQAIVSPRLQVLKRVYELLNKYSKYQDEYENPGRNWRTGEENNPGGNPQLYDALLTGCRLPYAKSTFDTYNEEIEQDIKEIVKLTPQSLNWKFGVLRCRNEVTPLMAACINDHIPLSIVEFLLENGANPNETVKVNRYSCPTLADLQLLVEASRFAEIEKLFAKYV